VLKGASRMQFLARVVPPTGWRWYCQTILQPEKKGRRGWLEWYKVHEGFGDLDLVALYIQGDWHHVGGFVRYVGKSMAE